MLKILSKIYHVNSFLASTFQLLQLFNIKPKVISFLINMIHMTKLGTDPSAIGSSSWRVIIIYMYFFFLIHKITLFHACGRSLLLNIFNELFSILKLMILCNLYPVCIMAAASWYLLVLICWSKSWQFCLLSFVK